MGEESKFLIPQSSIVEGSSSNSNMVIDTSYTGTLPDTSNLPMTSANLYKYLSNKQCCIQSNTVSKLAELQIGKNVKCNLKEITFSNILFEVLSNTTVNRKRFKAVMSELVSIPVGYVITGYLNGVQVSDSITTFTNGSTNEFIKYLINSINNYNSIYDIYVDSNLYGAATMYVNSGIIDDYDFYFITNYPSITEVEVTLTDTTPEECLEETDICEISEYLNKVCETC